VLPLFSLGSVHYHDFHLTGYSVEKFGGEIVLHLLYDYPPQPQEESHIRFRDVELYHFVHTSPAIIIGILDSPIGEILDRFWDQIYSWSRQHGGGPWDDDRSKYQARLEAESCKAWEIGSAIGFGGFVIAKSIEDATSEFTHSA
jgi:hypothetical protein